MKLKLIMLLSRFINNKMKLMKKNKQRRISKLKKMKSNLIFNSMRVINPNKKENQKVLVLK